MIKKHLFFYGALATLLSAASCSSDIEYPGVNGDGNVHFSVTLPDGMNTRAFSDGITAENLKYAVYQSGAMVSQGSALFTDKKADVSIDLADGGIYDFVFWAEADSSPYTFSAESRLVTVNYANMNGNNDNGDAFFHIENGVEVNGPLSKSVTLTRPLAQLNIGTSDLNNPSVANAYPGGVFTTVTTEAYTTLNLSDGSVSDPVRVTMPAVLPPAASEDYPVAGGFRYLSMTYVLVDAKGTVSDISIDSYTEAASATPAHTVKVPNAPLKRNYRTNVYGKLLSTTTDWNLSIDSEFGGSSEVSVWDGTSSSPVVDDDAKTVAVNDAAQLAGLASLINSGKTFNGYTVSLNSDIDLGNKPWKAMGNLTSYPSVTFSGTFEGNGHTIYNLSVSDNTVNFATAGLFGSLTGKVNNLNLVNGKVASSHYAGAICGYSSANVGMEISGCSVENFTIISTPELMADGSYDNGDKVGGIIGYMDGGDKVTDCVVKNTTVRGYRDIGGIAGYCNNGGPISGCTVEDVTLIQDFENGYKPLSSVEGHIGEIFGYGSNNGSGNTAAGVTISYANSEKGLQAQLAAGGNVTVTNPTEIIDLTDLNPTNPLNLLLAAPVGTLKLGTAEDNPTLITIEVADGVPFPEFKLASYTKSLRNLVIKGTPTSSKPLAGFVLRNLGDLPKDVTNVTFSGVHFDGNGVYMAHNNNTVVQNLVIEGCNFTNLTQQAVSFQSGGAHGNIVIRDNNIQFSPSASNATNGLYLLDFSGKVTVTGNTISGAPYHGIFCKSADKAAVTTITGNNIINSGQDGIKVENQTAALSVTGNNTSAQGNGIRIKNFNSDATMTITGNTINTQNMRAFNAAEGEPWGILIIGSNATPVVKVSGNRKVGAGEHWFNLTGFTPAATSDYSNPF